ncbi:uncharacterized protein CTHT_0046600 [Thermochaetoides thermophila DSM 1495]|uniref:F-box domain-containing protein n=1 Tax=Chaetomium thermophilum (strain DSM 1495 / CBS 144.50 / IMI 039719) TaxID=759272 RepID=G0S9P2_CHATD|nr:hypothetical protein CTHT_0046600 [Thermochaetoides thermophila DSM 1495]EGS20153.1 hypothetical protein CTHT_0046600 [Thermochaetoides thermophila DSM 1495]
MTPSNGVNSVNGVNGVNSLNGVANKTKPTTRRVPAKVVVPALPLNYPQRPLKTTTTVTKATEVTSPTSNPQSIAPQPTAEKLAQDVIGKPASSDLALGPSKKLNPTAPAISFKQDPASEPSTASVVADEREKDTPPVSSALPKRINSPARQRPPGPANPAPEAQTAPGGVIPEASHPAPHPAALMNRPAFHQPHPSNGSLVFGGIHDSNASSPAPRSGSFPPPGLLPYPPVTGVDGYGRPLVDGYPPNLAASHHGPPTPHSFQGSQSSVQADEHAVFNHYPAVNGHNGYPVDPTAQAPIPVLGLHPPMNGVSSVAAYQSVRIQDEALFFLRNGFPDDTWNDCVIKVRFADSPEFRVLATGHRFIFSRSPTLATVMKAQRTMPGSEIFLEAHDKYIRPDVMWYALRTLYGWPIAEGPLPSELQPRDVRDDFDTALSYLATGRFLRLPWVHAVGSARASYLLCWDTIEQAVKFVSQAVALSPRDDGFGVSELLSHVLDFLVHHFPTNLVLDTNAGDLGFSRLPPVPSQKSATPPIVNGTSHSRQPSVAHIPKNPRLSANHRLSQIKFGDISPLNGANNNPNGKAAPSESVQSPRAPSPNDTLFSRILLNLPFELLKQVLEHPNLGKLNGELSPVARQSIISDIIAEREARRMRTLEKVDHPQLRTFQDRLDNAGAPLVVSCIEDFWVNSMGFKEEVFSGDLPYLVHTWTQGSASSVGP